MATHEHTLRFDHKEIAVIFSLFVFVSLLMFTVGIMVGKGLTLAKYEGKVAVDAKHLTKQLTSSNNGSRNNSGTMVTTNRRSRNETTWREPAPPMPKESSLKLIPAETPKSSLLSDSLLEPDEQSEDYRDILSNPKIRDLLDDGADAELPKSRKPARRPSPKAAKKPETSRTVAKIPPRQQPRRPASIRKQFPRSYSEGKFTVQVASYPTLSSAQDRVSELQSLGFRYAFFSAKEIPEKETVWYRVWLGYFPDYKTAKNNAEFLQQTGEVRNYLVRKSSKVASP